MNESEHSGALLDGEHLRSFLTVADLGAVTRAASALGRTQSAISVQLKRLEERLGARLFEREARGVRLTDAGRRLLPAARRIIGELRAAEAAFAERLTGRVRVGVPDDFGGRLLERVLARFAESHPGVEVFAACEFSAGFPEAVAKGELDLAVYTAAASDKSGETLRDEPMIWAAHEHWTRPEGSPVPLALFDRACWWRDMAVDALAGAGTPFVAVFSSESVQGVRAAIAAGLAVGVLARRSLEPGMRALGEAEGFPSLPGSTIALLQNAGAETPATRAMAAAIRHGFSSGA